MYNGLNIFLAEKLKILSQNVSIMENGKSNPGRLVINK